MSRAELLSLVDRVQQERSMGGRGVGRDSTENPLDLAGVQALAGYLTTSLTLVDGDIAPEGLRPEDVEFFLLPALAGFSVAVVLLWPRRLGDSSLGLTAEEFPATKPDPNLSDDPYPGRPGPSPPDLGQPRERVAEPTDCAEGEESVLVFPPGWQFDWREYGCTPQCEVDPATGLNTGACQATCPAGVVGRRCASGEYITNFPYTIPTVDESACESLHCGEIDLDGVGQGDCVYLMEQGRSYEDRTCNPVPADRGDCHEVSGGCLCKVQECTWDIFNWTGSECTYEQGTSSDWSVTAVPNPVPDGLTVEQYCQGLNHE